MSENKFAAAGRTGLPNRARAGDGTFTPPTQLTVFSVRLPQDMVRALKVLSAEQDINVQTLTAEAIQLLLAQYGKK